MASLLGSRRGRFGGEDGFTVVEMLAVFTVIGMMAAVMGPHLVAYLGHAKVDTARAEMRKIAIALDLFHLDVGRYPTEREGLHALIARPSGVASWGGPYVKKRTMPTDPWGQPYAYHSPGRHGAYDLYSKGPEAAAGGSDREHEIGSW